MGTFDELAATFDPDPNVRGRDEFEPLVKWWLENDPEYRLLLRKVWRWDEWPGNDGADLGIDLVAEDHAGGVWAIQAKCTRADLRVSKREADSFLAASGKKPFTFRLLVTSADEIGANLVKTLTDQYVPTGTVVRSRLIASEVDWPLTLDDLTSRAPHIPKQPRSHQREAIDAVTAGFEHADRGQLIMACGTGKTLTALWITERLGSRLTLVLVPSLSLLSAALADWTPNANEPFIAFAVCSDETVTSTNDPAVAHTAELGIPVTTDPDQIVDFVAGSGRRVVFATYQSSPKIAEAYEHGDLAPFDLVIADEAHRLVGPANSQFTTILDNAAIPAARRLFMTATPRYFTGRAIRDAAQDDFEVASMDDETKFGGVFHRLNFSAAIRRDLLSDYQVAVVVIDDPTYRAWAQDRRFVTRDGVEITDAGTLASQIGLAKAMHTYGLRRIITFHHRIKNAADFALTLPDVIDWMPDAEQPTGSLWCEHISGKMTAGRRRVLLDQLRNLYEADRGVVANARCLSEGVDVPALDGVAFIDPKRSRVDIIQAVGRAIRKADDKTIGTIVIPVFVDSLDDTEAALDASAFKPVWDVISALRDQDDVLGEELDALRRQLARRGTTIRLPTKIILDVPTRVTEAFVSAFETKLVIRSTSSFEDGFGHLEAFVDREGHANVPHGWRDENDYPLGKWVDHRRSEKSGDRLSADRAARLENVPGWIWTPFDAKFEEGFGRLLAFVDREGHAKVPSRWSDGDGYPLGDWVNSRRAERRAGRLRADRVARLDDVPGWMWDPRDAKFEEGFGRLLAFVDREGHAKVPDDWRDENDYPLGAWVGRQRSEKRTGKLSDERAARLAALPGWLWDAVDQLFEDGLARLLIFVDREGHANVPRGWHDDDGYQLGGWVKKRRSDKRQGRLSAERVTRLGDLPGWIWDPLDAKFEEGFARLLAFVDREGHAKVPSRWKDEDGYPLGDWVNSRRVEKRGGQLRSDRVSRTRLSTDRVARLEALPGWIWAPHDAKFEDGFTHLLAFVSREGHANVPQKWKEDDGYSLGTWVATRRDARRNGLLTDERVARLKALPGWKW